MEDYNASGYTMKPNCIPISILYSESLCSSWKITYRCFPVRTQSDTNIPGV